MNGLATNSINDIIWFLKMPTFFKKVCVVGLGYVGLSTATLLARKLDVVGVDIDPHKLALLNQNRSPICDPLISETLKRFSDKLHFTDDLSSGADAVDMVIVCTPTNYDEVNERFDTSSIEMIVKIIASEHPQTPVVIKSTVPIGFTQELQGRYPDVPLYFSPEFLREGSALQDCLAPSRIIIGGTGSFCDDYLELLNDASIDKASRLLNMSTSEAEAVKLFANTYLAARVSFFNELDNFALQYNLDSRKLIDGVCSDPRIGKDYNNPSFGYGGYCLPKDTKQLRSHFRGMPAAITDATVEANDQRIQFLCEAILRKYKGKTIGVYRLLMKSGSDNIRENASLKLAETLKCHGLNILIFEPILKSSLFSGFEVENNFDLFMSKAQVIVANRMDDKLREIPHEVFTRDVYEAN